jgi:hypothetical protein
MPIREENPMKLKINPSDLYYKYPRNKEARDQPIFTGKPDAAPFDKDNQYEVIPMLEAVMNEIGSRDANVLVKVEELLIYQMPNFLKTREEAFDYLSETMKAKIA